MEAAFDALACSRKLENAGFTRQQAEVFREIMESRLVSRGHLDLRLKESEARLQRDIEKIRSEIRDTELRLIKWQIGGAAALAAIMAKGFGWLGF